jgi:hypothetical protein
MLIAATIVDRTLNRNAKIVRIAKNAPRPPSRTRPSRDSMMNVDRSLTVVMVSSSAWRSPISASLAWTASATSTVLALEPRRSRQPAWSSGQAISRHASSRCAELADGDRRGRRAALGAAGAVGVAPTIRSQICSTEVKVPIVGRIFEPSAGSCLTGSSGCFLEDRSAGW